MLQGHCHQKILDVLTEQAQRLTLSSRAFHNDKFPTFAKLLTTTIGYDMMLPMNTGAEGVETALKIAKKWAYMRKGVKKDKVSFIAMCITKTSCENLVSLCLLDAFEYYPNLIAPEG